MSARVKPKVGNLVTVRPAGESLYLIVGSLPDREINWSPPQGGVPLGRLWELYDPSDQETKTIFKESFDAVNAKLKEMFPKLFGGGMAELILTDENELNAGVVLMARPPGKKNSSISQLSGGEKALTALALVFAIFDLNPAPFCLLDEVDAPLDDLNTLRFVNMVEEMSETVQFIFITHNKVSMERSDHLMGVTMQEAGVSRVVSVDVNQAVEMAQS